MPPDSLAVFFWDDSGTTDGMSLSKTEEKNQRWRCPPFSRISPRFSRRSPQLAVTGFRGSALLHNSERLEPVEGLMTGITEVN